MDFDWEAHNASFASPYDPRLNATHHRNQAFAAALASLFGRHPAPMDSVTMHHRIGALQLARHGRIGHLLNEDLATLEVPENEIRALIALIYD